MDFSKINLKEHEKLAQIIVMEGVKHHFKDRKEFQTFRNKIVKLNKGTIFHNLYFIQAYNDLVREKKIKSNEHFLALIQKRSVRTRSGVAPVTVLTKPFPCPGKCVYCPTDVRMPKSYLPSQPAAQRGFRERFDPYAQVYVRLKSLKMTGHPISKVELRILGGTWSAYPKNYQTWFVKRCLQALNEFPEQEIREKQGEKHRLKKNRITSVYGVDEVNTLIVKSMNKKPQSWLSVSKENETADVKCIGINIETRPDYITKDEIKRLRYLGVTKIEMGVQTLSDDVYKKTKRGHTIEIVKKATKLLKDAGFKISYHMMPNLPGSTVENDKNMIRKLFINPDFKPDYLKIYPCVVVPKSELDTMYKKREYEPYDENILEEILSCNLTSIPEWCRLDRLARDIPSDEVTAGFNASNMRQILEERLKKEGTPVRDIRSREIQDNPVNMENIEFIVRNYKASGGQEFFLSYEDTIQDKIIALLRLRFPCKTFLPEIKGAALIREVHVYGKQIPVGDKGNEQKQHVGWGTKLLKKAEKIAYDAGFKKIAVISGIGTREYYAKKGYKLEGTYMVKQLTINS